MMTNKERAELTKKVNGVSDNWITIGKQLKAIREAKNLSAPDVAEIMGCTDKTVNNHESANVKPAFEVLQKYCLLYGCDFGYLLKMYEGTTFDRNYIMSETGLEDDAVKILEDKDNNIKRIDLIRKYINFLIKDAFQEDSLSFRIVRFMARYKAPDNVYFQEISPYYVDVLQRAKTLHDPYEIPHLLDQIEAQAGRIRDHFRSKGLTEDQIGDIEEETENFFEDYYYSKISEEFELNNIKYEAIRYIDQYLKEGEIDG